VRQARGSLWIFLSVGLVSASLTVLFLGMRSVMNIGGSCARVVRSRSRVLAGAMSPR